MAESAHRKGPPPSKIIEQIVEAGKAAFDPSTALEGRVPALQAYEDLVASTSTWILLPALNSLIKPDVLPPWLRDPLLQALTRLPLRPDGVRGTLEFVFSVHPSTQDAAAQSQQPQKSGANITHEAVAVATRLLSTVPATLSPDEWYGGIAPQLFALFDGDAGEDLAKTAAQIVGFGILGKKQMGAPGAAGWNAFVRPLIEPINYSLQSARERDLRLSQEPSDEIVHLGRNNILVSDEKLVAAVRRLKVLVLSNPSPGLCRRVLKPVLLQLWALASMANHTEAITQKYCTPAESLLQTYFTLFGKADAIAPFIRDILCEGSSHGSERTWRFRADGHSKIDIEAVSSPVGVDLLQVEPRAEKLAKLITGFCSNEEISELFLVLLRNWIRSLKQQNETSIKIAPGSQSMQEDSPLQELAELSILQKLMETTPDKLVGHFDQLMGVICQVLRGNEQVPLGDDVMSVILSLLNLVVTATSFKRSDIQPRDMDLIEVSLRKIAGSESSDVSATARNLTMLLEYRDQLDQPPQTDHEASSSSAPSSRQIEDRKTYNLAMNYITGDRDHPPPVVSEGLAMLSTLITAESPVLDITAVTVLMSNLLRDNEDYINLRVIKIFTQLANKHPKTTLRELLDNYLDPQEQRTTDTRLRFGEALLQVIERLGETFSGDMAQQTGETLLSIAGRRAHRPKTQAKQAREERLAKMKKKNKNKASARDSDEDEREEHEKDEDEDEDENSMMTETERANNEILAQIIQGWESKRGSEDIRMRASALSIFGAALEVNIAGMGPSVVSNAVDLCVHVLSVERDMEYAILRRAAILAILGFVRALHEARQSGRSPGFGLTMSSREDIQRTLEYVGETDNDGLVQQHARDVVESLRDWQIGSLLAQQQQQQQQSEGMAGGLGLGLSLSRLSGLNVNMSPEEGTGGQIRRRIEEID
ncbi:hypothetical protein E4U09_007671 [Claviceps aff. purpurea]|uniref:Protein required for cell viability n=1 Tax=Claviceps aff. purpurea TaxID=1967640 RepID=A0A9P7U4U5_9HYPO|nr:hypothetical protein E4U09_007671 [Claviceps aff. purpurea]